MHCQKAQARLFILSSFARADRQGSRHAALGSVTYSLTIPGIFGKGWGRGQGCLIWMAPCSHRTAGRFVSRRVFTTRARTRQPLRGGTCPARACAFARNERACGWLELRLGPAQDVANELWYAADDLLTAGLGPQHHGPWTIMCVAS